MESNAGWRNVKLLSLVSFLNDLSSEVILPVLPFFLISLKATPLGIGVVAGIMDGLSNIMKAVSGYFSDIRGKRKPLVIAGYALSQISKFGLALSLSIVHASGLVALDRLGKGIRTSPRDALIAESYAKRGKAFGFHRAMDTLGAVVGSAIAVFLYLHFANYRSVILVAALIGFAALIPLWFIVETGVARKVKLGMTMKKFLLFSIIFGAANVSYMFFLIAASKHSILTALLLYFVFNIFYASFSYPAGVLSDKVGKNRIASLGYLFLSASCLLMLFDTPIVAFPLFGLFMAFSDAIQRGIVSELAKSMGFGLGAFHFVFGTSALIANILYGYLLSFGSEYVFSLAGFMALVSAFVYWFAVS
ncbi:MAG: MFS transporter [Archaeoglobales archaeon]|nr:MAG: MFS transporter [Archaeoglobales archaeon]